MYFDFVIIGFRFGIFSGITNISTALLSYLLQVKIPNGVSSQFVLTYSDGSSHFFSTNNDVRYAPL